MKKTIAIILAVMLILSLCTAFAAAEVSAQIYVTVSDKNGQLAVAAEPVTVTDTDNDGVLTINDALYCTHEQFYDGGAAAGYGTRNTEYGLSLDKLWGEANGGSYGYYVNNISAWSLTDPVANGDYLAAFCYTDLIGWSDHYSYFDSFCGVEKPDTEFTLTYTEASYDKDWNPITVPVEGAVITVDGKATEIKTDAEGKATLSISEVGSHLVSAAVTGKTLVAPVFIANVKLFETVYVTISDKDGQLAVSAEPVTVTDTDNDGALTINDALYCAHEQFYDGGAAAGYATLNTEYGLSLDKLWGEANGGSYGYYVNGASAWSLIDPLSEGDYLYAFVYTDLEKWSDSFSTFDQFAGDVNTSDGVELTLTYVSGYDAYYMPVFSPLADAEILIDGAATGIRTDENGKAKVTFEKSGAHTVSAASATVRNTPPVFKANVVLRGDYNSNGEVEIMDATRAQRIIAELDPSPAEGILKAVDADADGELTIMDATRIQRVLAELCDMDGNEILTLSAQS